MNEANSGECERADETDECLNDFRKRFEKKLQDPKFALEAAGFIVLTIYAVFTIAMYFANQKAADAAKKSADVAEATLVATVRPWVSIDTGKLSGFSFDDNDGASVEFDLGVSTTGQTPALHVRALGHLVSRDQLTNPALQTRAVCKEVETTALRDVTIFPNQKNITVRSSAIWGKDAAKKYTAKSVNFTVLGCLTYSDSLDKPHHTGFTFDVYKKDPRIPDAEMPIDIVPLGSIGNITMSPNWSNFTTFAD